MYIALNVWLILDILLPFFFFLPLPTSIVSMLVLWTCGHGYRFVMCGLFLYAYMRTSCSVVWYDLIRVVVMLFTCCELAKWKNSSSFRSQG